VIRHTAIHVAVSAIALLAAGCAARTPRAQPIAVVDIDAVERYTRAYTERLEAVQTAQDAIMRPWTRIPQLPAGSPCPVHGTPLQREPVPIFYGLPCWEWRAEFRAAQAAWFPLANDHINGGCDWDGRPREYFEMSFCPNCRAARRAWLAIEERCSPFFDYARAFVDPYVP